MGFKNAGTPDNKALRIENSPVLIITLKAILSHIQSENARLVGSVYSTSGHDNQQLVYQTISWADDILEQLIGVVDDDQLLICYIERLNQSSAEFETELYDPDGAVGGTVVDLVNALKRFQEREQ